MKNKDGRIGRLTLREFVVEFLGTFVPGLVALLLVHMSLAAPVSSFLDLESKNWLWQSVIPSGGGTAINLTTFVVILVVSYVVGSFLMRLDPKVPDLWSYRRCRIKMSESELSSWVVSPDDSFKAKAAKREERLTPRLSGVFWGAWYGFQYNFVPHFFLPRGHSAQVEFPYDALRRYLKSRQIDELAEMIKWDPVVPDVNDADEVKDPASGRSKNFINQLKVHLQFRYPDECMGIMRNEGHVRLMASLWWLSRGILFISMAGIALSMYSPIINQNLIEDLRLEIRFHVAAIPPIAVFVLAYFMSINIEKFLHYQRVREIVHVLATSAEANKDEKRPQQFY